VSRIRFSGSSGASRSSQVFVRPLLQQLSGGDLPGDAALVGECGGGRQRSFGGSGLVAIGRV